MVGESEIELLILKVKEYLESNPDDLDGAVAIVEEENRILQLTSEFLLSSSSHFGSVGSYEFAYVFAKASSKTEDKQIAANSYYNSGLALQYMGRLDEAEHEYQSALAIDPKHLNTHSNYGILLKELGRLDEAEHEYQSALAIDPNDLATHYNYGILLKELGRLDEAEHEYQSALAIDPNDLATHYNYGILLKELGRLDEAEHEYQSALAIDPNDLATHYNYGILLKELGRLDEAEHEYQSALAIDPNDLATHYNYGILLKELGRLDEAEHEYQSALAIDPKHLNTHSNYGILLKELGRLDEAEHEYQSALAIDPKHLNTHSNYGNLLSDMGRLDEAEHEYQSALAIDPNDLATHYNYGILLKELGRLDEAEHEYQSALAIDPKHANAHGAYGIVLFENNDTKKSLEETNLASSLFKEEGNKVMEHLSLAWINELIADRYYEEGINRKKSKGKSGGSFRKSGQYASIAGDEYLLAGEYAEDKRKDLYLTKGYTLKGRAAIRQLDLPQFASFKLKLKSILHPHSYLELRLILSGIHKAADNYEKVAEISAEEKSICLACCKCMRILSEVLDFVQAATIQSKVLDIHENIEKWNHELDFIEPLYKDSVKGTNFVQALRKMISILSSFEKIKTGGRLASSRELELFSKELTNVIDNIEGPLQDVIDKSAQQMKKCAMKWAPYRDATEAPVLENKSFLSTFVRLINSPIISKVIGGLILFLVLAYFGLKD